MRAFLHVGHDPVHLVCPPDKSPFEFSEYRAHPFEGVQFVPTRSDRTEVSVVDPYRIPSDLEVAVDANVFLAFRERNATFLKDRSSRVSGDTEIMFLARSVPESMMVMLSLEMVLQGLSGVEVAFFFGIEVFLKTNDIGLLGP